jgi:hypothetical protein
MIAPDHSTTMQRQAVPSIILSVTIVCFFAVALYPRDSKSRKLAKQDGAKGSAPFGIEETRRGVASADGVAGPGTTAPTPHPAAGRINSAKPIQARRTGLDLDDMKRRPADGPAESTAGRDRNGEAAVPAIRMASNRGIQAGQSRPPTQGAAVVSTRVPDGRLGRAPFTVVGSGETIADVARRIYGTTDDAEALRRANLDILRGPAPPLAPGTVLHTPEAPLH